MDNVNGGPHKDSTNVRASAPVEVKAHPTETLKITRALAPPPNLPTRPALPPPHPPAPNLSITPPSPPFSRLFTSNARRKEFPGIQQVFLERAKLNTSAGSKSAVLNNAASTPDVLWSPQDLSAVFRRTGGSWNVWGSGSGSIKANDAIWRRGCPPALGGA